MKKIPVVLTAVAVLAGSMAPAIVLNKEVQAHTAATAAIVNRVEQAEFMITKIDPVNSKIYYTFDGGDRLSLEKFYIASYNYMNVTQDEIYAKLDELGPTEPSWAEEGGYYELTPEHKDDGKENIEYLSGRYDFFRYTKQGLFYYALYIKDKQTGEYSWKRGVFDILICSRQTNSDHSQLCVGNLSEDKLNYLFTHISGSNDNQNQTPWETVFGDTLERGYVNTVANAVFNWPRNIKEWSREKVVDYISMIRHVAGDTDREGLINERLDVIESDFSIKDATFQLRGEVDEWNGSEVGGQALLNKIEAATNSFDEKCTKNAINEVSADLESLRQRVLRKQEMFRVVFELDQEIEDWEDDEAEKDEILVKIADAKVSESGTDVDAISLRSELDNLTQKLTLKYEAYMEKLEGSENNDEGNGNSGAGDAGSNGQDEEAGGDKKEENESGSLSGGFSTNNKRPSISVDTGSISGGMGESNEPSGSEGMIGGSVIESEIGVKPEAAEAVANIVVAASTNQAQKGDELAVADTSVGEDSNVANDNSDDVAGKNIIVAMNDVPALSEEKAGKTRATWGYWLAAGVFIVISAGAWWVWKAFGRNKR